MPTKAYILIETAVGKTRQVVTALRAVEAVKVADPVTGPYDVILVAETKDLNSLGELVDKDIHRIPGITRTVTCLAI